MQLLDLSFDDPMANLALDEALLLHQERSDSRAGAGPGLLRLWEPPRMMVVLGRGSIITQEVQLDACQRRNIPVLRRCSGGAAILAGPGCLMYALIFGHAGRSALPVVNQIHEQVLSRLARTLGGPHLAVVRSGTSDLALQTSDGWRKFSGNSLRISRQQVLYHGTILYDFPLDSMGQFLAMPPRMPAYRQARPHDRFLCNLPLGQSELRQRVAAAFEAHELLATWPRELTAQLVARRYSQADWNAGRVGG
jgi:lipoate-protein ligase A